MKKFKTADVQAKRNERGQSMVEYALIVAFVIIAFAVTLAMTGPAIGNVFSNVVYNLVGVNPGEEVANLATQGGPTAFWATVTWVAGHPQGETPYPTQITLPTRAAPTAVATINTPDYTHTYTPTSTSSRTPTSTPTYTLVPTSGPSPTPEDKEFPVPFADRANNVLNWRLDRSYVLNAAGWAGQYFNGSACPGTDPDPAVPGNTAQINYNWESGSPDATINNDNFVGCWETSFTTAQDIPLRFVGTFESGALEIRLNGSTLVLNGTAVSLNTVVQNFTVPAGTHLLSVRYAHATGDASVSVYAERVSQNPSDEPATADGCPWATTSSNLLSGSPMNVFDDDPATDSWPSGQRCFLELRGWVNAQSAPNPKLSFWDVWDFLAASGIEAELQIANYVETSPGSQVLDRSVWNSPLATFTLRQPGTANYNWTRTEIDLSSISGLGSRWTFRFALRNASGSPQTLRWYIDDVQVLNAQAPARTFTVNDLWNLNQRSQMRDFIFNADANFTEEQTSAAPASSEWRWNLTSDYARSGTAFSLKGLVPSASPTTGAPDSPRVFYLEFTNLVDLTVAPAADSEGDAGDPILSFWHAYRLSTGASIRVEYTRDSRADNGQLPPADAANPESWTVIPDTAPAVFTNEGMLLNFSAPSTGGRNEANPATERTSLTMKPVSIRLSEIPNWNSQPFRLRFALVLNEGATINPDDGWFIDDIRIERDISSPFVGYPFVDSAESATFTAQTWIGTGGWAASAQGGGVNGSGQNYTDSPGTGVNYPVGGETWFELRRKIDLLGDTPGNTESTSPAVSPTLSFWMRRDLRGYFDVEIWTPTTNTWTLAWRMDNNTARSTNTAWERVEIDLREALRINTNETWGSAALTSDADREDDDIRIRFRLQGVGGTSYDGIYIDEIRVADANTTTHRLWTAGDGTFIDDFETNVPTLEQRWYAGGTWNTVNNRGYLNTIGLTDSPAGNYTQNARAMVEIARIFDLSNTVGAQIPSLDFMTRSNLADQDVVRVEIAERNAADSGPQVYNDMFGWNAWAPAVISPIGGTTVTNTRVDTPVRWRVDLRPYVGRQIRIRFVLESNGDATVADGLVLDNVSLRPATQTLTRPWAPNGSLTEFVTEGTWSTTSQFFAGGTTGTDLGSNQWYGLYFDCETLMGPIENLDLICGSVDTYSTIMTSYTDNPQDTSYTPPAGIVRQSPNPSPNVDLWLNSVSAPPGTNPANFTDTFGARWARSVTLNANTTYRFYAISNGGFRLAINDRTGITSGVNVATNRIFDLWYDHNNQLDFATVQVGGATINRVLTLEYFDTTGDSVMSLSASSGQRSYSDSPNTPLGSDYNVVLSSRFGNSALVLDRVFSTPAGGATLTYNLLWKLSVNNTFTAEVSYDGGFTWTVVDTIPNGAVQGGTRTNIPPTGTWVTRTVPLNANQSQVTFRFRLDTRARGDTNSDDGVWVADIQVS